MAKKVEAVGLRSQLKATSIKKLKKRVDEDNEIIGAYASNEYLNLEDGKLMKIRIFPAHPGIEDFYVPKKCYWLTVAGRDGDMRRTTVLDSKVHGGTKMDLVDEYVKFAKKKWSKDSERLEALTGNGQNSNSLNPTYSWLCYAAQVTADEELRAKLWEFKKMVRDAMNKLAFSEDEDEAIEVDPFTDPDEGLPIMVKFMKKPNKKKGENFYEVSFPKKVSARPLTDEEIEYFMTLKPLNEVVSHYGINQFEIALEGLQNFDEEHNMELFEDEDWLEKVEDVKAQYDVEEEDEDKPKKKTSASKKSTKKVEEDEEEEDEEEVKPKKVAKKSTKKVEEPEEEDEEEEDEEEEVKPKKSTKKVEEPEEEDEEEEDEEDESEDDGLDEMERSELKKFIKEKDLEVSIKKSMSDDDIRAAIRASMSEDEEEDEDEEEEAPKSKVSLSDIKKKLAGKK